MPITAEVLLEHGIAVDAALSVFLVEWLRMQELDCMSDLRMCGPLADLQGHMFLSKRFAYCCMCVAFSGAQEIPEVVLQALQSAADGAPMHRTPALRAVTTALVAVAPRPLVAKRRKHSPALAMLRWDFNRQHPPHTLFMHYLRPGEQDVSEDWLEALCNTPTTLFDVTGMGPVAAIKAVVEGLPQSHEEREAMWKKARIAAVMGNCAKTKESFKSGAFSLCSVRVHAHSQHACVMQASEAGSPLPECGMGMKHTRYLPLWRVFLNGQIYSDALEPFPTMWVMSGQPALHMG